MAKHTFNIAIGDRAGNIVGVACKCGKIVEFENFAELPEDAKNEECKPEDFGQAAVRIVRESTQNS